jgi:U4/U6.U5 tri-snRNP-associated protein 2
MILLVLEDLKDVRYDLVANICHEGKLGSGDGSYKVHIHSKGNDQWFQIQDLFVEEIAPQMIFLSESYIQVGFLFMMSRSRIDIRIVH